MSRLTELRIRFEEAKLRRMARLYVSRFSI
jgi:hypothetical protein